MPLIILGLLLVAGLTAYIILSEHPERFVRKKKDDPEKDSPSVIFLDEERKKRAK